MALCSHESSMEKMKNLLCHALSSINVKGTIANKSGNQLTNIALTVLNALTRIKF